MNLTPILDATIIIILIVITRMLIPWIRARTTAAQQETLGRIIDVLVQAAEQLYEPGAGADKLQAVKDWLAARGYDVDIPIIEAAVYRLNTETVFDALTILPEIDVEPA